MDNVALKKHLNTTVDLLDLGRVELAVERLLELNVLPQWRERVELAISLLRSSPPQVHQVLDLLAQWRPAATPDELASLSMDLLGELDDWFELGDAVLSTPSTPSMPSSPSEVTYPPTSFSSSPAFQAELKPFAVDPLEALNEDEPGFGDLGGLSHAELAEQPEDDPLDLFEDLSEPASSPLSLEIGADEGDELQAVGAATAVEAEAKDDEVSLFEAISEAHAQPSPAAPKLDDDLFELDAPLVRPLSDRDDALDALFDFSEDYPLDGEPGEEELRIESPQPPAQPAPPASDAALYGGADAFEALLELDEPSSPLPLVTDEPMLVLADALDLSVPAGAPEPLAALSSVAEPEEDVSFILESVPMLDAQIEEIDELPQDAFGFVSPEDEDSGAWASPNFGRSSVEVKALTPEQIERHRQEQLNASSGAAPISSSQPAPASAVDMFGALDALEVDERLEDVLEGDALEPLESLGQVDVLDELQLPNAALMVDVLDDDDALKLDDVSEDPFDGDPFESLDAGPALQSSQNNEPLFQFEPGEQESSLAAPLSDAQELLASDWDDWDRDLSIVNDDDDDDGDDDSDEIDAEEPEAKPSYSALDSRPGSSSVGRSFQGTEMINLDVPSLGDGPFLERAPNWAEVLSEPISESGQSRQIVTGSAEPGPDVMDELDDLFELEMTPDPSSSSALHAVPSFFDASGEDEEDMFFPGSIDFGGTSSPASHEVDAGEVTSLAPAFTKEQALGPMSESAVVEAEAPVAAEPERLPVASSFVGVEDEPHQPLDFGLDDLDLDPAPANAGSMAELEQGAAPWDLAHLDDAPSRPPAVTTPQHDRATRQMSAVQAHNIQPQYDDFDLSFMDEDDEPQQLKNTHPAPPEQAASFDDVFEAGRSSSDPFDFELDPYDAHHGTVQREAPVPADAFLSQVNEDSVVPEADHAATFTASVPESKPADDFDFDFDLGFEPPVAGRSIPSPSQAPFQAPVTPGLPPRSFDRQKTPANTLKPEVLRQLAQTAPHEPTGVSGTVFGLPTSGPPLIRPTVPAPPVVDSLPEDEFFELAESLANEHSSAYNERRQYRGEPMLRQESSSPGPFVRPPVEPEPAPRENPFAHEAPTGVREPLPPSVSRSYTGVAEPAFELEELAPPERDMSGSSAFVRRDSAVLSGMPSALKRAKRAFEEGRLERALELVSEHIAGHGQDSEATAFRVKVIDELERAQLRALGSLTKTPQICVGLNELAAMNLDHRFGFIISQIDGMMTYEDILDISHLPRLETISLLVGMLQKGIIKAS